MDQSGSFKSPPASSSGKPSLSKPRFIKVRKNAPYRKPSSLGAQEPAANSGFNPFRLETVEEKIGRWSPFIPEPESRVLESLNASFDEGSFAFGSGGPNLSRKSSVKSESKPLAAQEPEMGRTFSFGSNGRGESSSDVFVTGNGVQMSRDSRDSLLGLDEKLAFSKLMYDMRKGRVESRKQAENVFVFGDSNADNRSQENAEPLVASANFRSEGSGKPNSVDLDFGSGMRKGAGLSWDSSLGLDEGLFTKLAEETRKLNLDNPGNVDDFERKKKQAENVFVSGGSRLNKPLEGSTVGSTRLGSEGSGTSKSGVFVFGSGVSKTWNSSLDSEETVFSVLADQTRKLNLNNPANVDDFEKKKQAQSSLSFGGSEKAAGSSGSDNLNKLSNSAGFTSFGGFGTGSKSKNTGLQKPAVGMASLGSHMNRNSGTFMFESRVNNNEGLFSKLPDEIKKMNLSNGDDVGELKSADNVFVFGGSMNSTGSFGCGVPNKVAEENCKSYLGKESIGRESAASVFGSNGEKVRFSSQASTTPFTNFYKGSASALPSDKKPSTEGVEMDKGVSCKENVKAGDSFMFGSGENASTSSGGSAFNTLHGNLEKLKIGSKTEKLAGSTPFTPIFQEGNQYPNTNTGSIPSFPCTMFSSLGKPEGLNIPHTKFKTPKQNASWLTKESLFMEKDQNVPFSVKNSDAKSMRRKKKKKGKIKQPAPLHQSLPKHLVPVQSESEENPEVDSSATYSPMDYSPYREDIVADQYSREPSVASDDSVQFASHGVSVDTESLISIDEREEVLVSAAERLNIHEDKENFSEGEVGTHDAEGRSKRSPTDDSASVDRQISGLGKNDDMPTHEETGPDSNFRTAPMEAETGFFNSNVDGQASERETGFTSYSSSEYIGKSNFTFSVSPAVQGPFPTSKCNYSKSSRSKSGQNPPVSTSNVNCPLDSPLPDSIPGMSTSGFSDLAGIKRTASIARREDESTIGKSKESEVLLETTSTASVGVAAQAACEKWRFRGNQAYGNGHLSKAEDCYTRGISSVPLKEIPSSCIQPLALCYSNRAATRMSLGRMREALRDCKMAVSIDPDFLKARVRVGNCHLALGEIEESFVQFKKCLQLEKGNNTNHKYLSEAADGLQKVQQVSDMTSQAAELLLKRTWTDTSEALNLICEALSISPHSERLMEMKAKALLMMRNYEEVIKLCEQTLHLAEQNSFSIEAESQDCSEHTKTSSAKLWRWLLVSKSYFYLGKLEEALELLQKQEEMKEAVDKLSESSMSFANTIHELIRLKFAGNEAFQLGRHSEAVEYYTAALACSAESRPFTAVCFCNRAAAYQALGQITDAIADCSLAIAFDGSYPKAISRRATLHEMIRDYGQAANDLNRLISLLETQVEKVSQARAEGKSTSSGTDLKQARARLAAVEEEGRKGISLNMYMILGIEPSSSAVDVKKAYRKAALRHHPDKAGQFFVKNGNVDDGLWKEVAAEVQADADRLFKMIGEAYNILSDPTKRLQYDDEEDMRTTPRKGYYGSNYGSATSKSSSDTNSSYYEKNVNRRQWQTHGSSYQQW